MKPRIEKKLSKKLAEILVNVRGFTPKNVWIDKEYAAEKFEIHWKHENPNGLTSKQKRENNQRLGVEVDNMPSVGGGLDYWGEATDFESVFLRARDYISWWFFPCVDEAGEPTYPQVNIRLTGKTVIDLARKYVSQGGAT